MSIGRNFGLGLVEAALLAATVSVPLYFNPSTERVFEPDKLAMLQVAGALALAGFVWHIVVDGWQPQSYRPSTSVGLLVVLLVAIVCVAAVLAPRPDLALWGSYRRATGLPTYLALGTLAAAAAASLGGDEARRRWGRALTLSVLAASFYTLLQRVGVDSLQWGEVAAAPTTRAFGPLGNPIFLGAFVVVALPFVLVGTLGGTRQARLTYAAVGVLACAALVAAASRGPIVGVVSGAGFALLVVLAASGRRRPAAVVLVAAVLLASTLFVSAAGGRSLGALGARVWESRTSQERLLLWETILGVAGELPVARVAVGYGPDSVAPLTTPHLGAALVRFTPDQTYDRAHNLVLEWWVTGGAMAVLALAALLTSALLAAAKAIGLVTSKWALPGALCTAAVAAGLAATLRLGLAPIAGAAGLLAGTGAYVIAGRASGRTWSALGKDRAALVALAVAAALAAHVAEASFGLPSAPSALVVWVAIGLAARLESDRRADGRLATHQTEKSNSGERDVRPSATSEGIVDGIALATVAFAPLLLPSPLATSGQPALWLLVPALWIAGDLLADAQGGPWSRPAARVGVLIVFGALFAVHPRLGPGGASAAYAATLIVATLALAVALGGSATPAAQERKPKPWRMVAGAAALILCLSVAWRQSVRPVMADGRILASLHSGARGDHATAVREAEAAASEWPQQPALASYVAAAHRAVMLDGGLSPEVRQTAFESAARVLEDAVARAPSSDLAAKLGDLYRDRGDAAAAGSEANDAWTTALEWYDRSLQLQPTFPAALEAYASTLERLGDYDGASSLYQSALTIDPPRHSARAGLVRVSLAANDLSRAREALSVGLAVDASALGSALDDAVDTRADQVRVLQSRLLFALETGAVESAATLADQLRARAPDDPISRELMTDADAARD